MARSDAVKIADAVTRRLDRSDSSVQSGDLAAAWITAHGGVKGLVESLSDEYDSAPKGGIVRTKIHEMMLRGLKDQSRGVGKLSEMETDDVKRVLVGLMAQREAVFDASEPPPGPAAAPGGEVPAQEEAAEEAAQRPDPDAAAGPPAPEAPPAA